MVSGRSRRMSDAHHQPLIAATVRRADRRCRISRRGGRARMLLAPFFEGRDQKCNHAGHNDRVTGPSRAGRLGGSPAACRVCHLFQRVQEAILQQ